MAVSIIGNGMMAHASRILKAEYPVTVFASGVSDSGELPEEEYQREINLLLDALSNSTVFVYYSSYVAGKENTRYAEHKRQVESIIQQTAAEFIILRLPQVVGFTKNKTLINYIIRTIANNQTLKIQKHAYRSLIDVDDVMRVLQLLLTNETFNILLSVGPSHPIKVIDIVKKIGEIINSDIQYEVIDAGICQEADLTLLKSILRRTDELFSPDYQFSVLKKYATNIFHANKT